MGGSAENDVALRINTVNLKNRLRDIQTDRCNRIHDTAPLNLGNLNSTHVRGAHVPVKEPSTASLAKVTTIPDRPAIAPQVRRSVAFVSLLTIPVASAPITATTNTVANPKEQISNPRGAME
jgi:hypothetical protein